MLETYEILLIVFVAVLLVFLIFKSDSVTGIKIDRDGIAIKLEPVREKIEKSGIHVVSFENKRTDLPERDAIIESFSALKEVILSLAIKEKLKIGKNSTLELVNKLIYKKILNAKLKEPISDLYNFGKLVMDQPYTQVPTDSGKNYHAIVYSLVNDIREKFIGETQDDVQTINLWRPKKTEIGSPGFLPPTLEKPSVVLHAITGSIQGKRFPIDKSNFCIGANSRNDLVIPDDKFVSDNHAHVCYDNGNLSLFDNESTNGTFLNNERIGEKPYSLRVGDRIKIGGCILKVG